jgi:kinesin family protein 2/24
LPTNAGGGPDGKKKGSTVNKIEQIKKRREERRAKMENMARLKAEKAVEFKHIGSKGNVEEEVLIDEHRFNTHMLSEHVSSSNLRLCVCVRKRPLFEKEQVAGENDAVSCANPQIKVHFPKLKVDGITKYIDNHLFTFDNTFNQDENTQDLYTYSLKGVLPDLFKNSCYVTVFAYGQTGSGKTFTMQGVTESAVNDMFSYAKKESGVSFYMNFFEIYGGRCFDLLDNHKRVAILEDGNNNVRIILFKD